MTNRPQQYRLHHGDRVLPFAGADYDTRLSGLRELMQVLGVEAWVFTSMRRCCAILILDDSHCESIRLEASYDEAINRFNAPGTAEIVRGN